MPAGLSHVSPTAHQSDCLNCLCSRKCMPIEELFCRRNSCGISRQCCLQDALLWPSNWFRMKLLPCLALPQTATTPTGPGTCMLVDLDLDNGIASQTALMRLIKGDCMKSRSKLHLSQYSQSFLSQAEFSSISVILDQLQRLAL